MTDQTLAAALVRAQAALTNPHKNRTANTGTFSYTYADLSAILDHVRPVLGAEGLAVTQNVTMEAGRLEVYTTLHHVSGDFLVFGPLTGSVGSSWQALGSAITYARRYALTAALGIAADDDDDANGVTPPNTEPLYVRKPVERVSHSDQAIADSDFDPWQTPEQGSNAAQAVAEELLGATEVPKGNKPRNHPEAASDAQKGFVLKLITPYAVERGVEPLAMVNMWLIDHNYGPIDSIDELGWRAAKPLIDSLKNPKA